MLERTPTGMQHHIRLIICRQFFSTDSEGLLKHAFRKASLDKKSIVEYSNVRRTFTRPRSSLEMYRSTSALTMNVNKRKDTCKTTLYVAALAVPRKTCSTEVAILVSVVTKPRFEFFVRKFFANCMQYLLYLIVVVSS